MQNTQPETYSVTNITSDVIKEEFPRMSKEFKDFQVGDRLIGDEGWHDIITQVYPSIKLERGDPPRNTNHGVTWVVISDENYKRFYNPELYRGNLNIYILTWKEDTASKVRASYDVLHSIVVVAKDEYEARNFFHSTGGETREHTTFWKSEEYTSCREIGKANKDQREGIVCRDFHNG